MFFVKDCSRDFYIKYSLNNLLTKGAIVLGISLDPCENPVKHPVKT